MEAKKSPEIPITRGLLEKLENRITHKISSFELNTRAQFKEVDARFNKVDARFKEIDARFDKVDVRFKEVDARFDKVDVRFKEVDARFDKVDARFKEVDARFDKVDGKLEKILESVCQIQFVVEDQRADTKYVLDGYSDLRYRQKETETRVGKLEKNVFGIKQK